MPSATFLRRKGYQNLIFYKKTVCLYDLTYYFATTYLSKGDRTVDQMIQAARSGKQNIIEGTEAAMTSTETEIKLNNVARASLAELLADYHDYLRVHNLSLWDTSHPRYNSLVNYCFIHNDTTDYNRYYAKWSDEEMANTAITLIHQVDTAMNKYIAKLEQDFIANGGLREKMTQVRLAARQNNNPKK